MKKLEKEADEYAKKDCPDNFLCTRDIARRAYLAGAEPREKQIEVLKKENADLKKKNTALRQDWDVMKSTITDYEKENEELTKKLEGAERARDYWKDSSFDWRHKCTSRKPFKAAVKAQKQLSKAKALLSKWVELYKPKLEDFPKPPIQVDTEQFLKETENE